MSIHGGKLGAGVYCIKNIRDNKVHIGSSIKRKLSVAVAKRRKRVICV